MAIGSMEALLDLAGLDASVLPETSRRLATLSLFDWMTVGIAARDQPLATIVRDQALAEGGAPLTTVIGSATKLPARAAALVNGTISHALDYDDTHFAHIGHLSVGIYPAALAAAEEMTARASALRDAFLLGAEGACRIGLALGRGHYQRGFHQTATAGAFGAALAAGRVYGLTRDQMRQALSLVATRSSGLKSQFGTMGKPFNAGLSASNGIEAASLARRGFRSCDDGIDGPQGFIDTHSDAPDRRTPWQNPPPEHFVFDANSYKLHACCHGTHAMIEALHAARRSGDLVSQSIANIIVRTHPRWISVCDIKQPRSALEVKFSYRWLAAMIIAGIDTASDRSYHDGLCSDENLERSAMRVDVVPDPTLSETESLVAIVHSEGGSRVHHHDLAVPTPPEQLEAGLRNKSRNLLGTTQSDALWDAITQIDSMPATELAAHLRIGS